ncbi:hypothetical protein PMAYCL1PPCAC_09458, partial [Pristionchus mayeri]
SRNMRTIVVFLPLALMCLAQPLSGNASIDGFIERRAGKERLESPSNPPEPNAFIERRPGKERTERDADTKIEDPVGNRRKRGFGYIIFRGGGCVKRTTTARPSLSCKSCAGSLIRKTVSRPGTHPMDGDVTGQNGAGCSERNFTCRGANANIEINGNAGVVSEPADPALAELTVTCNAAGTAWEYMGVPITQVECGSGV